MKNHVFFLVSLALSLALTVSCLCAVNLGFKPELKEFWSHLAIGGMLFSAVFLVQMVAFWPKARKG